MVFAVIPCGASSSAMQRTAWTSAAFDAAYAVLLSRTMRVPTIEA